MDNHQSFIEKEEVPSLQEAWNRYVDDTYTCEDLTLILDSIRDDAQLQAFYEVGDRVRHETITNTLPLTEEQEETYKRRAAQLFEEYERKHGIPPIHIASRTLTRFRKIWYAAAAAVLLGLLVPVVQFLTKPVETRHATSVQYVEAVTGRGEIKTIVLPDQTKVTLNAESRLTFPAVFANERSVELQGEAIFDVTHDNNRQFVVTTADMNVRVLGTVFDVKAYSEDKFTMVSVVSGKVEVNLPGGKALLEKNNQVKMNKTTGGFEKLAIDAEKYLSWTNGMLLFNDTPIHEVVNMLNRSNSQMVFELVEGEYPILITGRLDTKMLGTRLDDVMLSFGLKYKKTGAKIILYNDDNEINNSSH